MPLNSHWSPLGDPSCCLLLQIEFRFCRVVRRNVICYCVAICRILDIGTLFWCCWPATKTVCSWLPKIFLWLGSVDSATDDASRRTRPFLGLQLLGSLIGEFRMASARGHQEINFSATILETATGRLALHWTRGSWPIPGRIVRRFPGCFDPERKPPTILRGLMLLRILAQGIPGGAEQQGIRACFLSWRSREFLFKSFGNVSVSENTGIVSI